MAQVNGFQLPPYLTITQMPPQNTSCHDWIKHIVLKAVVEDYGKVCAQDVVTLLSDIFTEEDGLTYRHVWAICRKLGMIPMKNAPFSTKERTYLRWPLCPFVISNMVMHIEPGRYVEMKVDMLAKEVFYVSFDELLDVFQQMQPFGLAVVRSRNPKSPKGHCKVRIYNLPNNPVRIGEAYEVLRQIESV